MLSYVLSYAFQLYLVGLFGFLFNRNSLLILFFSFELILLGVLVLLLVNSLLLDNFSGLLLSLYILIVAASEASIGLALLVAYYRLSGNIAIVFINLLRH